MALDVFYACKSEAADKVRGVKERLLALKARVLQRHVV
jgi:hypothetical protein